MMRDNAGGKVGGGTGCCDIGLVSIAVDRAADFFLATVFDCRGFAAIKPVHGEFAIYAAIGSWNSPRQWGCHITSLLEAGASDARQGVERIGGRENMKLIEIPENQWPEFCKGFSREHRGWLVNLRCVNTD